MKAASSIADMADSIVGSIGRFQWDIAVTRIGQLASEMKLSTGGQSIGGSNGNADELTNWNGKKREAWEYSFLVLTISLAGLFAITDSLIC